MRLTASASRRDSKIRLHVRASGSQRLIVAWLALLLVLALPAWAQGAQSAAQELAAKYSPVLSLAPQAKACGSGEAYRPTTVDIALGRQDVLLRDPHGQLVKREPTSRDLGGLGPDYLPRLSGQSPQSRVSL
jgi:hypothetical protein